MENWDQRRPEIKRCFFAVADQKEKEEKRERDSKSNPNQKDDSSKAVGKERGNNGHEGRSTFTKKLKFVW